jgi:RNA polymerase sigma factor (TIGR02999 family)
MHDVTQIISALKKGNPEASGRLLKIVYDQLRDLATRKIANERSDITLQATGLVHEAYLRLMGSTDQAAWNDRSHFFAAASEAMRRILVEAARRRSRLKRGGDRQRQELFESQISAPEKCVEILAVHESLDSLEAVSPESAQLVKLRYFAGFTIPEAAEILQISPRKANQIWTYARTWLLAELTDGDTQRSFAESDEP